MKITTSETLREARHAKNIDELICWGGWVIVIMILVVMAMTGGIL